MDEEIDILAIGNPLLDLVAFCDAETCVALGIHPNSNIEVSRERLSEILVALPDPVPSSGGGAAKVAKLAALMGHKTAFIGSIGSDPHGKKDRFARHFELAMERAGVTLYLKKSSQPTGATAFIHMPGDLYSVVADPGAALDLVWEDIDKDLIRQARLLMLDGFLLSRRELLSKILKQAEDYGTTVALDLALPRLAAEHASYVAEIASQYPLILFMNETEAYAFNCALGHSCDESNKSREENKKFSKIIALCQEGPFPIAVVKRGERGVSVYASGMHHAVPTRSQTPFERSGVGDAFSAGFLSGWLAGKPLRESAQRGNRLAREMLSVMGSDPDRERLQSLKN